MRRIVVPILLAGVVMGLDWAALSTGFHAGLDQVDCHPGNLLVLPMLLIAAVQLIILARIGIRWGRESTSVAMFMLAALMVIQLPLSCNVGRIHGEGVARVRKSRVGGPVAAESLSLWTTASNAVETTSANGSAPRYLGPSITIDSTSNHEGMLSTDSLVAGIISTTPGYPGAEKAKHYPYLVIALYEDGRLIWSEDAISGGPPYRMAHTDEEEVKQLRLQLESSGFIREGIHSHIVRDSAFLIIYVNGTNGCMNLRSSHEPLESGGKFIAREHGFARLKKGSSIADILSQESIQYQEFRATWSAVKGSLLNLIPPDLNESTTVTIKTGYFSRAAGS